MGKKIIWILGLVLLANSLLSGADTDRAAYIRNHYAKYEYRIPMRDGSKLFTSVYIPYDDSKEYPILLTRTPYSVGPYGADNYKTALGPHEAFEKEGFIFVFQDVRGRFMSEGHYVNMRPYLENKRGSQDMDESTDTYDTIDWLVKHLPHNNGRVGMWGISYPGFYTSSGAINSHPALKAISPQAPIADWFWDDMHHHGAFILPLAFNFFSVFGQPRDTLTTHWPPDFNHHTPDGYQFFLNLGPLKNVNTRYFHKNISFWNDITAHPNYDAFWQSRNILPHLKNIKAATMVVGGWYDAEDLYGSFHTYQAIEKQNPRTFNILVIGPWFHGGWVRSTGESLGDADFGFPTSQYYQEHVDLRFFTHFLKDDPAGLDLPEALVFETGANRWREFAHWPPATVHPRSLYLRNRHGLAFERPEETGEAADSYASDPDKPVPYTTKITTDWEKTYMTEDQRFAALRPDVLVYQTDVLEENITVAGPVTAHLFVSTTGTASDFVVKVIDVYPNEIPGYTPNSGQFNKGAMQQMVRGEAFRGRFRSNYEQPEPFVPGQVTPISFQLQDILHTFQRGHRIMVQIQSSWFPLVDRNPGRYVPNIFEAGAEDFIEVTNRIYRSRQYPSHLEMNILEY